MRYELKIAGMSCDHCVRRVEKALAAVDGVRVEKVAVGQAVVEAGDGGEVRKALIEAIGDAGYEGEVVG